MSAKLVELSIPTPDGDSASESMTALTYAEAFKIAGPADALKAQEARARLNTRIKALNDARLALTRPIDAAKKTIMDFFAGPIATFERAKRALDQKIIAWDDEQERLRREEQRKAEAAAQAERDRLQKIADEAKRKADAEAERLRREAADAEAAGNSAEAAKLVAKADRVEEKAGAKVEAFESRAAATVAPIIQVDNVKAAGTSLRENWTFRITDATKINSAFLIPDETKIGKLVKSLRGDAAAIIGEGIEIYAEKVVASRRA